MNIAKYPYAIAKLYNLVRKEKSFLNKYFLTLDLFDSILKYLYFLTLSSLNNSNININSDIDVTKLKRIANYNKSSIKNNSFTKEINNPEYNFWEKVTAFEDFKNKEADKPIGTEEYYKDIFSEVFLQIEEIIKDISFIENYQIIVPVKFDSKKNTLGYISLGDAKFQLNSENVNIIIDPEFLYLHDKLKNEFIKLDKIDLNDLNYRINYIQEKSPEELINLFHHFILNNHHHTIKLNFLRAESHINAENIDILSNIYLDRNYINNKFESFIKTNNSGYLFIVGSLGTGKTTSIKNFIKENKTKNFISTTITSNTSYEKNFEHIVNLFNDKYNLKLDTSKKIETPNNMLRILNQICRFDDKHIIIFEDISVLDNIDKFLSLFPERLPPNVYIFFTMSARESLILPSFEAKEIYYLPNFNHDEIKSICEKSIKEPGIITNDLINEIYKKSHGLPLYVALEIIDIIKNPEKINKNNYLEGYLYGLFADKAQKNLAKENTDKPKSPILMRNLINRNENKRAEDNITDLKNNQDINFKIDKIKKVLESKFINLVESLEYRATEFSPELKNYGKYFLALLSDSKEGYNKVEIKNILFDLPMEIIEYFIDRSGSFLIKINGRYKLSYLIYDELILNSLSNEEIKILNSKVIDFFEPWDKKVSSLTLKYLPYHYIKAGRIDELKVLLCSTFVRSKFKIYPQETLNDFIFFIRYLTESEPDNIADITKFCFIYQKLKEEYKKELLNVIHLSNSNKYTEIIKKVDYINKPMEKFYQFLLISNLAAENKNLVESRNILKTLLEIPEISINQYNSELIFRLCAEISSAGVLDIISVPRTREDGMNLIKYLTETPHINKVIEVLIKLLDAIPNEVDRAVLIETLMNKVTDFKNINTIDNFFQDILPVIERIKNINLKDRLYYVYISSVLKKPELYNKELNNILEMKDKLETSLFKFLFYGNLALLFLNLKQEKISKDFIIRAISFISDLENLNHQSFMFNSMIAGFRYFEKTYFFNELIEYAFSIINEASFNYEKIERSLNLLNQVKKYDKTADILKSVIKDFSKINEKSTQPLLRPFILSLEKLSDKRVRNPLLKKLSEIAELENQEYKINFYSILLLTVSPDEKTFDTLKSYIDFNSEEIKPERILEIISTNVLSFSSREYSEKLFKFVLSNIDHISNENAISSILMKLTDILGKAKFSKTKEYIDEILVLNMTKTYSSIEQMRVNVYITFLYANLNEVQHSLNLLHKLFAMIIKEKDENRFTIISEIYKNINHIKDHNRSNVYISNLLNKTYSLFSYIKKEEIIVKIVADIFTYITKFNYPELKNIFYKTLEITNKIINANNREEIIGIIRMHLPIISERNYLIDILQKSILISEENFSQGNIRLLSLIEIAALNERSGSIDVAQRLMRSVIAELRFFNFEEYSSDVMIHISRTLSKFNNKNIAIELFKNLLSAENSLTSEKIISKTYSEISYNLVKIGDFESTVFIFASLLEKSLKLRTEGVKTDYLIRFISHITSFGFNDLTNEFIKKVYEIKSIIKEEDNLVNFYKSFIVSLNKLNNPKILEYLDNIQSEVDSINDTGLKTELLSLLGIAYFKYRDLDKSNKQFDQSISMSQRVENLDKRVNLSMMLALKLFSANREEQAKVLIDSSCKTINKVSEENHKFELVMKLIGNLQQLSSLKGYKDYFYKTFEQIISFRNNIHLVRVYMLLGETCFKLNEIEYSEYYFQQAISKSETEETYEAIEYRIRLGITLIQNNNKVLGNEVLLKTLSAIKTKPKRVYSELVVKMFNSIIILGENQYSRMLFNEIIQNLESINIKELNENELYKLAYTYAYKNQIDEFKYIIPFIKNKILLDKLINSVIDIFVDREDSKNLTNLLIDVINDSKNLDRILSALLSFNIDSEQIKKITDTIIIS